MRHDNSAKYLVLLISSLLLIPLIGYEDNTHQRLTERSLIIAAANADGIPSDLVSQFVDSDGHVANYGLKIINGAGAPETEGINAGEDYTDYEINTMERNCSLNKKVEPHKNSKEPLNHFKGKMLGKGPASKRLEEMWQDAVDLWKHGDKQGAAFILGRVCHLIEDMAQPQHAMNESHPDKNYLPGIKNLSFIEEFSEASINSAELNKFCANSYYNYNDKIGNSEPDVFIPYDPITSLNFMQMDAEGAGNGYLSSNGLFSSQSLRILFPSSTVISPLCNWEDLGNGNFRCKCNDLILPFQKSNPVCDQKILSPGNDFKVGGVGDQCVPRQNLLDRMT